MYATIRSIFSSGMGYVLCIYTLQRTFVQCSNNAKPNGITKSLHNLSSIYFYLPNLYLMILLCKCAEYFSRTCHIVGHFLITSTITTDSRKQKFE